MMRGQAEESVRTAKLLLDHSETEPRLSQRTRFVNRNTFSLASSGQVRRLAGLGKENAREFIPTYHKLVLGS